MNQEIQSILAKVDHTLLAQSATWNEIKAICDDGIKYGCASVCIPASYVKRAAEYVDGKIAICTVIGFPNGYDTTAAKCFEAEDAVNNGASEVDMVINIGWVKDGLYDQVLEEIRAVKAACHNAARYFLLNNRLPRQAAEGHHRDLYAHRCREDRDVPCGVRLRRRVHQDLHRLRRRRRHP